jgi:hypothetical protein
VSYTPIVMKHWSATRFMLFDQCPGLFRDRYVDGLALEPTEAMCFGSAVHKGLEAHYNGGDGEQEFRVQWKAYTREFRSHAALTGSGLELLNKVFALDLHGVPEQPFQLETTMELGADIVGALDLYDAHNNVVYDFKTTRGKWSQARAQAEVWQPLLYTWSVWDDRDQWPAFEYIVLNRVTGTLERFRREWTADEWLAQMNAAWLRMCEVSVAVAQGRFDCTGGHGTCPECGERWTHGHVCDETTHSKRIRLAA